MYAKSDCADGALVLSVRTMTVLDWASAHGDLKMYLNNAPLSPLSPLAARLIAVALYTTLTSSDVPRVGKPRYRPGKMFKRVEAGGVERDGIKPPFFLLLLLVTQLKRGAAF